MITFLINTSNLINYTPLYLVSSILTILFVIYLLQKTGYLDKLLNNTQDNREGINSYVNSTEVPKYFEFYGVRYPIVEIIKTTKDNYGNWEGKLTYTDNSGSYNTIAITNQEYEINNEPENIMNNMIILKFLGSGENNIISQNLANSQNENMLLKNKLMVLNERIIELVRDNKAQMMKTEQEKGAIHGSRTIMGYGGSNYDDIKQDMSQESQDDDLE